MDLSKLPKLSQTPPPPDNTAPSSATPASSTAPASGVELFCRCGAPITPGTNFCSHCGADYHEATGGRAASPPRQGGDMFAGGMWIEAFVSIAVGLFLMLIAPNGIRYLTSKVTGSTFAPYVSPDDVNKRVDFLRYTNMQTGASTDYKYKDMFDAYWSDMAVTSFALALILEGLILALIRNRWVILLSIFIILGVTILNIWYIISSYNRINPISGTTYGLPPISAIAVIFGVVMAGYQILMVKELSATSARRV